MLFGFVGDLIGSWSTLSPSKCFWNKWIRRENMTLLFQLCLLSESFPSYLLSVGCFWIRPLLPLSYCLFFYFDLCTLSFGSFPWIHFGSCPVLCRLGFFVGPPTVPINWFHWDEWGSNKSCTSVHRDCLIVFKQLLALEEVQMIL